MAFDVSELEGGGYLVGGLDDFVDEIVVIAYVFGWIWDCCVLVSIDLLDQSAVVTKAVDRDWVQWGIYQVFNEVFLEVASMP